MTDTLLVAVVMLLGLILLSLWAVLYQVVKQQGRMLLRLDEVERRSAHGSRGTVTTGLTLDGAPARPRGLPVGTPFAPFHLPDLTGQMVTLDDFGGQQQLLVYWSPQCGFCDLIAPDLAVLQADLSKRNVQLVLVSYGDAEANSALAEEHGLACPILLLQKEQRLEAFTHLGTPSAYLLDAQGQVLRPVAVGADQVLALAREAAAPRAKGKRLPGERPLSESHIERHGLKPGTPAPPFQLPDVYGRPVSLQEYRGRKVLLIFTDPHCGPCDQLAPHLVRLYGQHRDNGPALVMIGRGDPEENRRKVETHGFEFPVVLQRRWELSKAYGIFATPVAFLVGEEGVIAREVAIGTEAIMVLAQEGLMRKEVSHELAI
jgi:peroxiredoxin